MPLTIIAAVKETANIEKEPTGEKNGGGTFWRLLTCHRQSCPLLTSSVACFFFSWAAVSYGDGVVPCTMHTHCQTHFTDLLATRMCPALACLQHVLHQCSRTRVQSTLSNSTALEQIFRNSDACKHRLAASQQLLFWLTRATVSSRQCFWRGTRLVSVQASRSHQRLSTCRQATCVRQLSDAQNIDASLCRAALYTPACLFCGEPQHC